VAVIDFETCGEFRFLGAALAAGMLAATLFFPGRAALAASKLRAAGAA